MNYMGAMGKGPNWFLGASGGVDYIAIRTFNGRSIAGWYNGLSFVAAGGYLGGAAGLYVKAADAPVPGSPPVELTRLEGYDALSNLVAQMNSASADHLIYTAYRLGRNASVFAGPMEIVELGRAW